MKVRLSTITEDDLAQIAAWIAQDNPLRAISFAQELRLCCHALGELSGRFPVALQRRGMTLRKRTYENYLILYVVGSGQVEVARIVHGARNWRKLFR